jgi:hypothetical protein
MSVRLCAHCGRSFSLRPQAIYCSRGCNSNARYRRMFRDGEKPMADLTAAEIDAKLAAGDDARRAQRKRFVA